MEGDLLDGMEAGLERMGARRQETLRGDVQSERKESRERMCNERNQRALCTASGHLLHPCSSPFVLRESRTHRRRTSPLPYRREGPDLVSAQWVRACVGARGRCVSRRKARERDPLLGRAPIVLQNEVVRVAGPDQSSRRSCAPHGDGAVYVTARADGDSNTTMRARTGLPKHVLRSKRDVKKRLTLRAG